MKAVRGPGGHAIFLADFLDAEISYWRRVLETKRPSLG